MAGANPGRKRIAVTRDGGITQALLHTDGSSLVFDATVHREIVELADWLRQDERTRVVIFGGTGEDFRTSIDTPSFHGQPVKGKDFATSLGPWLVTPDTFLSDGDVVELESPKLGVLRNVVGPH